MSSNWHRINPGMLNSRPQREGGNLPPRGAVVSASVSEDLGDGVYALKWGGNRVTVASKFPLVQGQELLLRSELSPEGKPVLVVQQPPRQAVREFIGRPTYGPVDHSEAKSGVAAATAQARPAAPSPPPGLALELVLESLPDAAADLERLLPEKKPSQSRSAESQPQRETAQSNREAATDKSSAASQSTAGEPAADKQKASAPATQEPPGATPRSATAGPEARAAVETAAKAAGDKSQPPNPEPAPPLPRPAIGGTDSGTAAEIIAKTVVDKPIEPPPARGEANAPPAAPDRTAAASPLSVVREALEQAVKALELPPTDDSGVVKALAERLAVPEAVENKAAALLLRAAGLSPSDAAMEAAKALMHNNAPVDRANVQALMAMAAGLDGATRDMALKAAARLAAKDIPLALPLVAGMTEVLDRRAGAARLIASAMTALDMPPEAEPTGSGEILALAKENLKGIAVDLNGTDAPAELERYVAASGREPLAKTLALIEKATQLALENHPVLPKLDQAIARVLFLLDGVETAPAGTSGAAPANGDATSPTAPAAPATGESGGETTRPAAAFPEQTPPARTIGAGETGQAKSPVVPAGAGQSENITLLFEAAEEALQSGAAPSRPGDPTVQPVPMDRPAAIPTADSAVPAQGTGAASPAAGMPTINSAINPVPGLPAGTPPLQPQVPLPFQPGQAAAFFLPDAAGSETPRPPVPSESGAQGLPAKGEDGVPGAALERGSDVMDAAKSRALAMEISRGFEAAPPSGVSLSDAGGRALLRAFGEFLLLPGLNRPEFELLRPSGFVDKLLAPPEGQAEATPEAKAKMDSVLRELLSADPERAEQALRELPGMDKRQLRELASRLIEAERQAMDREPVLTRLADAASSLRDLGRQLLAVKAENLAGQDRNPGVMLAEVPFKLDDGGGDGRMQMFYRRSGGKAGGWSARVILDLNTTSLGPVLGDIRFFGKDIVLNMFVKDRDAAAFLDAAGDELAADLETKGFRVKPRFMVMPPPPKLPEPASPPPTASPETDGGMPEDDRNEPPAARIPAPSRGRLDTKA